jgi:hypothetical protein
MRPSPKKPEPDTQTSKTYRNQSSHQQPELPELVAPDSQSRISNLEPVAKPNQSPNPKQPNPKQPGLATRPNPTNNLNAKHQTRRQPNPEPDSSQGQKEGHFHEVMLGGFCATDSA